MPLELPPLLEGLAPLIERFIDMEVLSRIIVYAKLASFLASVCLIAAIIIVWRKNAPLEKRHGSVPKPPDEPVDPKIAVDIWVRILKKAEKGTEQDFAFAVIEADKLVDSVLKSGGFPGDTMAERLKRIDEHQLASIEALWEAHKLRNKIVHEPGFRLEPEKAQKVLGYYQRVLEELEVI